MTPQDASIIAKEIVTLWTLTQSSWWGKATDPASFEAKRAAEHFAGYLPNRILQAVRDCTYEDAKRAPNVAQILERVRVSGRLQEQPRPHPNDCSHPQPWSLVDERTDRDSSDRPPLPPLTLEHPVGTRVGRCLRCGLEFVRKPGQFLTDGELDERSRARAEAKTA